mmetsp:Transcript_4218/g.9559  ORF Transcript_4218/g.9559 Transcript_4218/m.9559 type:complete len:93 (+) Transcript_4218:49-327(+)
MSSVLARASRALRTAPARSVALRRMCTAAVEEVPGKLTMSSPEVVTFGGEPFIDWFQDVVCSRSRLPRAPDSTCPLRGAAPHVHCCRGGGAW